MKKILSILMSLLIFQSQAFSQPLGFSSFINVGNKTTLTGAVIGSDTNNLTLTTQDLEYNDLEDINTNKSTGFGLSTSIGFGKGESNATTDTQTSNLSPKGTTTLSFKNTGNETEQTTKATIGEGTIIVGGVEQTDLAGLNRDMTDSQTITKDMTTGALDASVTIDNRLLTSEGRKDIASNFTNIGTNLAQIGRGLTNNIVVQSIKNAVTDSETNLFEAIRNYTSIDETMIQIQENKELTASLNGLTNKDAQGVKDVLQETVNMAGENGGFVGEVNLFNEGIKNEGYAYQDNYGQNSTIGINTNKTDLTNSGKVMNTVFHETENFEAHQLNKSSAL